MMKSIELAFAVNENYAQYLGATLLSILAQHPDQKVVVHVLYSELSEQMVVDLQTFADHQDTLDLHLHAIGKDMIGEIPIKWAQFPLESFYRFLLPMILPEVDRILYLDVDILVKQSLNSLYEVDLQGCEIAAVRESDIYAYYQWYLDTLGFSAEDDYFSSGVLVMDLALMRKNGSAAILLERALAEAEDLKFPDQDILNTYYRDQVHLLSAIYNYTDRRKMDGELAAEEVVIEHFNGVIKPWHALSKAPDYLLESVRTYQAYQMVYRSTLPYPKISLVLPVQGNEFGLKDCLESLAEQSYSNLEIICLLENPTPQAQEFLDIYKTDERFVYLSWQDFPRLKEQVDLGEAFGFVRAHNKLDPHYAARLWQSLETSGKSMVVTTFALLRYYQGVFRIYPEEFTEGQVFKTKSLLENLYHHAWLETQAHKGVEGKLYRTILLDKVGAYETLEELGLALYLAAEELVIGAERLYIRQYEGEDEAVLTQAHEILGALQEMEKYRQFLLAHACQTKLFDVRYLDMLAQLRQRAQELGFFDLVQTLSQALVHHRANL